MERSVYFNPTERQKEIYLLLQEHGHLTVPELALRFQVSEMTIRRDLKVLALQGLIQREHGGAIFPPVNASNDEIFFNRLGEAKTEKTAIGLAAASLIKPGESVILDAGTTTLALAKAIEQKDLNIITNSIPISMMLTGQNVQVFLTGGEVRESTYALVGPITRASLSHFNADKLFLAATGISLERGLSTTNLLESEVKQTMIKAAKETILVAHSGKFGQVCYHTFADWSKIQTFITDDKLPEPIAKELKDRGVRLILVPVDK